MGLFSNLQSWASQFTLYFIYILFISTLGPLLFGYHLAELNAPQDVLTCVKKSITLTANGLPQCIPMKAAQIGLVSSIFTLGGAVGALAVGPLASKYGRLRPMRVTTAFFALGPVAEALAPNIATMAIGRFVSGLGAGAALVIVPIYISEIAPRKDKGFFGAFTQIMTNTGIFVTQLLGYFLSHGQIWRVILAIGGIIGLVQLAGLSFVVDSPKWRAEHGQRQAAREDLKRIRGDTADVSAEIKEWNLSEQDLDNDERQTLLADTEHNSGHDDTSSGRPSGKQEILGAFEVLRHPHHGRATFVVMTVLVAQQLCGINSIVMYGVSLLSDLLKANSALLNIFVSILNIVVTTACAPLVDIWGRRICLMSSIAGMGISSVLLGIGIRGSVSLLSAVAVLMFVAAFGLGLGPVPFILSSELVGPEAVGATQSWGLAANWMATFIVAQFFPIVNEALGKGIVYFIFAGLAAVFFVFVAWFVPESMGKVNADEVWGRDGRRED